MWDDGTLPAIVRSISLSMLQEADVDLDGLDWIVCHSGADIWHGQQSAEWDADDQWEQLIDFR